MLHTWQPRPSLLLRLNRLPRQRPQRKPRLPLPPQSPSKRAPCKKTVKYKTFKQQKNRTSDLSDFCVYGLFYAGGEASSLLGDGLHELHDMLAIVRSCELSTSESASGSRAVARSGRQSPCGKFCMDVWWAGVGMCTQRGGQGLEQTLAFRCPESAHSAITPRRDSAAEVG